jgi:hypothetical protein
MEQLLHVRNNTHSTHSTPAETINQDCKDTAIEQKQQLELQVRTAARRLWGLRVGVLARGIREEKG